MGQLNMKSQQAMRKMLFALRIASFSVLFVLSLQSCNKNSLGDSHSSIRIIETQYEPKQVRMVSSSQGNILAYVISGGNTIPPVHQELFLLKPNGELIRSIRLSDTLYQYISAVKGINGGYFLTASGNNLPFIANYKLDDNGNIEWSKVNALSITNYNVNAPSVAIGKDMNYLVMYQQYGSGYFIQKISAAGVEVSKTKLPSPNANHYGTGLNYGENHESLFQLNDSLIVIQGLTFDQYGSDLVENCFLRAVDQNMSKKWYSSNFDSTRFENAAGLHASTNGNIILFGNKAQESINEGFGDVFARTYSTTGVMTNETIYPRVEGTPTRIRYTIPSPDGGFLLIGSNNQLAANDLVSPNKIVLMKLDAQLNLSWSKSLETADPAKGFDASYLQDGSIAMLGLLKSNLSTNKLLYLHLDPSGNLINQ